MVRWEPGARERLQEAALDLFAAKGFEATTVSEIAEAAGVTERTFFRHFADKREVLFGRGDEFARGFTEVVAAAPPDESPMQVVTRAVLEASSFFDGRHPHSSRRQTVIAAHAELRERELLKMAGLAQAVAAALRDRGVPEPAATLAAESGVTVFRIAFDQWVTGPEASLTDLEREVFAGLESLG